MSAQTKISSPSVRFDGKVAIVTGAGGGLGRAHALQLASRGAKVVVNDLGFGGDHADGSQTAAERVAEEIRAAGGQAIASGASVTNPESVQEMVEQTMGEWGRVDMLINNAGILRDRSFSKMSFEDIHAVIDVHLMGSIYCTKAVWEIMKQQKYGRIVMTTSSSGLFGNFGQANYGAAKMALVGLMQTLGIEGEKYNIRVNCLAPTAATRMTQGLLRPEAESLLSPESVTPGMLYLVTDEAPTKMILCAGAGTFSCSYITLTDGLYLGTAPDSLERLIDNVQILAARDKEIVPNSGAQQAQMEVGKALAARER